MGHFCKAFETRSQDISYYSKGFKGLHSFSVDGTNFKDCYLTVKKALEITREREGPVLIRKSTITQSPHFRSEAEWYRDDLEEHTQESFSKN